MMKAHLLLQELCCKEEGWDDTLTDDLKEKWQKWLTELAEVQQVTIPRVVAAIIDKDQPIILHGFGDASEDGYCAVICLVVDNESDKSCNISTAKAKLTPLKKKSTLRLELIAGRTLEKLVNTVKMPWMNGILCKQTCGWIVKLFCVGWKTEGNGRYL